MLKKKLRRLSAMLMAGVMAVSMMGTAFADETNPIDAPDYEATPVYVLNYSSGSVEGYKDFDAKRLYDTPYRSNISVMDDGELANWNYCTASVLNMLNPALIDSSTEATEPYASIPVYCVDAITSGVSGHAYRRVNLEDAVHFDDEAAGRVRAIFMNSFPYVDDMDAIAAAVNKWNVENNKGFDEVKELNIYEVISATQGVIWTITNNGLLGGYDYWTGEFIADAYAGFVDEAEYDWEEIPQRIADSVYHGYIGGDEVVTQSEYTRNNINAVAYYLESLAPMAPQGELISAASFEDAQVTYAEAADGTLTATVKAKVNAEVQGATELTLTAVCEGKAAAAVAVQNGTKTYTLTIEGLSAVSEISLAIDGIQENGDVYLFDPIEGYTASQSMAGYDTSALPVHAETKIVKDQRILNIHKVSKVENPDGSYTQVDLANIVFDVYFVGTLEGYLNGEVEILDDPTTEGLTKVASLKTDKNGEASLNLTRKGLADGVYLVAEQQSAATTEDSLVKPFYVMLPYTSDSGNTWEYVINANPKNDLVDGPEIKKDITKLDNNFDSFGVGENHTWIITADKPADIADAAKYEITDTLDTALDYVGNVKVTVEAEVPMAETTIELVADTDYTAVYDEATRTLTVSLTEAGMDKAAAAAGDYIRVCFDSKINSSAIVDTEIPNTAALTYTNSTNFTYEPTSDTPEIVFGGFCLVKVDGASKEGDIYTNKLAGAEFTLYREATEAEIADAEEIVLENGETKKVIAITTLTSDAEGSAAYSGLAYGTYYLVETKAPARYNLLLNPVVVTIGNGTAVAPVTVENFSGFEMPSTGGIGTTVYTLMGTITMATSGMYLFRKKRED